MHFLECRRHGARRPEKKTFYESISKFPLQYPQLSPVTLKLCPKAPFTDAFWRTFRNVLTYEEHRRGPQRGKKVVLVS